MVCLLDSESHYHEHRVCSDERANAETMMSPLLSFIIGVKNYGDTDLHRSEIHAQFLSEEEQGLMIRCKRQDAEREHGQRLRVASLGSVLKSDDSFRVLHDATHRVWVNPEIRVRDQVENFQALVRRKWLWRICRLEG